MSPPIRRRALAELIGTGFLVAAVVGSGIAAQQLSPHDVGLQLLESAIATGAALVAIILAVGPVSGAHLNPVVTLADRWLGGVTTREALAYISAQMVGGSAGAVTANAMFALPLVTLSTHQRATGPHIFAEVIATFGLVLVVFGVVRSGRASTAALAVGSYIAGAYWFTSSTSFANPAVTFARMLSNTFAGIAPSSVGPFVLAELGGGAVGLAAVLVLYPRVREVASRVILPHEEAA